MFRLARRTSAPFALIVVLLLALSPTRAGGSPGDLVVNGVQITLEGSYTYDNVFVKNGGRIVVGPLNKFLELRVTNTFLVDATSSVIANGLGIGPGDAPVYSYGDWIAGGGGAAMEAGVDKVMVGMVEEVRADLPMGTLPMGEH